MDDLDFSQPSKPSQPAKPARPAAAPPAAPDILYDPNVAFAFFSAAGRPEEIDGGKKIFAENDKSGGLFSKGDKMYLLIEGLVGLMSGGQFLATIRPGEIFGEMAAIAGLPRTASATAQTKCKMLSLDEKQFQTALGKTPEFALMLMQIMVGRLRAALGKPSGMAPGEKATDRGAVFDRKMMAELQKMLEDRPPMEVPAQKVVVAAGAAGTMMYVLVQGSVAITIGTTVVERIGPGGLFGEMALVDRSARAASAIAEADSTLLALNRNDFLAMVRTNPAFGASLLKAIALRTAALTAKK